MDRYKWGGYMDKGRVRKNTQPDAAKRTLMTIYKGLSKQCRFVQ